MLWDAMVQFYLWWLILYYVWIFVALGSYIERHAYQTLWDRILVGLSVENSKACVPYCTRWTFPKSMGAAKSEVMKPVGPMLQKLLTRWPKLLVQLIYLFLGAKG